MSFESQEQHASYGIGRQMADQLAQSPFPGFDREAALAGFTDAIQGEDSKVSPADINAAFQAIQAKLQAEEAERSKVMAKEGEDFLANNAKRGEVSITDSGLQYEVLQAGEGEVPKATDTVSVHYHGTLIDGTVFDSSVDRGQPAEFPVTGVIAGWVEALQLMPVGSKWKLFIPYQLAYGERGAGGAIGPYSALVFEVELLAIV
ncbi:FKBP-type peptidyl-prolyl cis-trans isomerase [Pseudoteredinibacter isoporae]|uniref:Peptidyl-prolyl cis-trans isomerase n=1 Tax=Pseudoteredinibacter isoporae TaxID=570281 RepID=A0A7X0JVS4_9GAMM|nr:FKBP-type peptidyl-prolyl cis-trans isomerase [Pseudoteredinibacter isoporae]MBB6523167.1 FKBP-type peptidyl-prolyl cis-trans isomerase FklB [Pseudoteredinibacter isoporae]NHO88686.1 FKBP-type peptidyl-prolyl cis-trans isomerase [Pseudoteredinibacter isoporae]NIB22623.1 FKBP-type peptidyl-prolyl cis-trans isomerase [Pseudoteredinibacter isoporae]